MFLNYYYLQLFNFSLFIPEKYILFPIIMDENKLYFLSFSVKIIFTNHTTTDKKEEIIMMYTHFCKECNRIYILNGHKQSCPKCQNTLTELRISYLDYVALSLEERTLFLQECQNETSLPKLSTTYRMYKYSKWYKTLQEQVTPDTNSVSS